MATQTLAAQVSNETFLKVAKPVMVNLFGQNVVLAPREFKTGSFGYGFSGKIPVQLPNGDILNLQVGINATAIGSKPKA